MHISNISKIYKCLVQAVIISDYTMIDVVRKSALIQQQNSIIMIDTVFTN